MQLTIEQELRIVAFCERVKWLDREKSIEALGDLYAEYLGLVNQQKRELSDRLQLGQM